VGGHRPPDDPPREAVGDSGQAELALAGRDLLEIGDQSWLGAEAANSRQTRSSAGTMPGTRTVVPARLRRMCAPSRPAAAISRSTRFLPTRTPSSQSSAWMRGEP